ncbi:TonB-dependent receptor [Piscinibacter koreensis]|uniref:TonB-dependent receptor n=1 Tax=Piscinibacter koreensis TaxID=2742824 RepID=A0A7Y6NPG3_9BURK|nr:TonB-dependent receptor [Schlegelella koreensis]NUZ06794.1 TonB-dependent receptor [Schlegelella koreensis]
MRHGVPAAAVLAAALPCHLPAQGADATAVLAPVTITGHYDNAVGTSDAASAGVVRSELLRNRPALRPGEVLEFVPGIIVTQHSGDGKANQYFLRGFNLDHGTDFATFVDGLPVNMPTHAHGHGYTDLNWLIPELVARIRYRKGPYAAEDGDFSSAGSARIDLFDALPRGIASVTLGQDRFARSLVANSARVGAGELLYAIEAAHNDGPWEHPENLRRFNGVLRYSSGSADSRWSLTAMGYSARWNSTDQIPQRAVDAGLVGRYGALDPTDGGRTERASLSFQTLQRSAGGEFRLQAYAIRSKLDLFSNFTYFLERPEGDQFEQAERRTTLGITTSRSWNAQVGGLDMVNTLGLQVRHDRLDPVGLYTSVARRRTGITQESEVEQTSVGIYGESALQWTPWLRSVAGLRADRYHFDVASSIAENSGERSAGIGSPKLSLIFGPWAKTEYFVNVGQGFHSNDARGSTARRMAKSDESVEPATPLVRSKGAELGVRSELVPGLQASLALWQLRLGSELLFVGDAGETEASRPSRRRGVELGLHYRATEWLLLDADLAASRARFTGDEPEGNRIPGSIDKMASLGVTVLDRGPWSGQFQLRYLGPRPLVEDDSKRSKATTLAYLRVGYRFNPKVRLAVDVFNLFDRKASDIDYYYESRLAGESAGVPDRHSHPVEPRRVRVTLTAAF